MNEIKYWFKKIMDEHSIDKNITIYSHFNRDKFINEAWKKNYKIIEQNIGKEIIYLQNFEDMYDDEKRNLMIDAIDANSDEIFYQQNTNLN